MYNSPGPQQAALPVCALLTQQVAWNRPADAMVVLSLPPYTAPPVHVGLVLLPKGLPQVTDTLTVLLSTLLVLLKSGVSSWTLLVLLPGVSARTVYV
jgi:hypothetical protein